MIKVVFKSNRHGLFSQYQKTIEPAGADEATFLDDVLVVKRLGTPVCLIPRENVEQVIFEAPIEKA